MKDPDSLHLKVMQLADCYAETDPLSAMATVKNEDDKDEAALKWLALAVLHGIGSDAEEITLTRDSGGAVRVTARYRLKELPSPGPEIGKKVIESMDAILHADGTKAKMDLALGIRESNVMVKAKVAKGKPGSKVTLKFGR